MIAKIRQPAPGTYEILSVFNHFFTPSLIFSLDTTGKKRGAALATFKAFQEQETPRTTMQVFIKQVLSTKSWPYCAIKTRN